MSLKRKKSNGISIFYVALAISAISLLLSIYLLMFRPSSVKLDRNTQVTPSVLQTIQKDRVLKVGYGGFPPYTIVDIKESDPNKRVTGFAVDMVNEIAQRSTPPLKVEWYNLNWDTMKADMLSGKFDFLADAVYQTVPRALEYGLSEPYSYFGIAVALVRKDDTRFEKFSDLDRRGITISLAEGYTSTEYAQKNLSKPELKIVPVGEDAFVQLDDVLLGRSDVALQDVPTILQYVDAHKDKVKPLWLNNPPSTVAAGFVTRREDKDLLDFLNVAIRILKVDGTLKSLDKKWNSLGYFVQESLVPGTGIPDSSQN